MKAPVVSNRVIRGSNSPRPNYNKIFALEGNGARPSHKGDGHRESEVMYTLNTIEKHGVAYSVSSDTIDNESESVGADIYNGSVTGNTAAAVTAATGICNATGPKVLEKTIVNQQYAVRRLTPLECERLQGLPDGYTLIEDKSCSDSARYKALGNGMAQPCADFVMQQIRYYTNGELTLGSLFDGIGGWLFAAENSHIKPIWASEIEKFPIAVTKKHYPTVKHLGDITKINIDELPSVDIVCAGSPCQDLSIAGTRSGLEGERSGLFRKAVDIFHGLRKRNNSESPRFFVWENVPGAFSSNKGLDFKAVLEEIGQTEIPMPTNGKWAAAGVVQCPSCKIAWRTLDAQYWGVPQRRKRIFLVADFAESNRCAKEILFVEQGMSRHFEKSTEQGQNLTTGITECTGDTSRNSNEPAVKNNAYCVGNGQLDQARLSDKVGALNCMHDQQAVLQSQYTVDFGRTADRIQMNAEKSTTLSACGGGMGAKTGLYCLPTNVTAKK